MAGLQRSEISFRRSGSSGLVWDDKFLSGELNKVKTNEEKGEEELTAAGTIERSRSNRERPAYRARKVSSPPVDPPSPKASAGCCGGVFGKPRTTHKRPKFSKRN